MFSLFNCEPKITVTITNIDDKFKYEFKDELYTLNELHNILKKTKLNLFSSWNVFRKLIELNALYDFIIFFTELYLNDILKEKGYPDPCEKRDKYDGRNIWSDCIILSLEHKDKNICKYFIRKKTDELYIFSFIMEKSHEDDNLELLEEMWNRLPLAELNQTQLDEKLRGVMSGNLDEVIHCVLNNNIKMFKFICDNIPLYAKEYLLNANILFLAFYFNRIEIVQLILINRTTVFSFDVVFNWKYFFSQFNMQIYKFNYNYYSPVPINYHDFDWCLKEIKSNNYLNKTSFELLLKSIDENIIVPGNFLTELLTGSIISDRTDIFDTIIEFKKDLNENIIDECLSKLNDNINNIERCKFDMKYKDRFKMNLINRYKKY